MDPDALFVVLSNPRRRFVLVCLDEYGTPMRLSDLADELAEWEHDAPLPEIPADEVQSIYLSLYHHHLPKMEDAGIVEYSQERDAVHLYEEHESLVSLVDIDRSRFDEAEDSV